MVPYLRIGRPSRDPDAAALRYCTAFALEELARFEDHEGFDGVIIGKRGAGYQLEFTRCRHHEVVPASTAAAAAGVFFRQGVCACVESVVVFFGDEVFSCERQSFWGFSFLICFLLGGGGWKPSLFFRAVLVNQRVVVFRLGGAALPRATLVDGAAVVGVRPPCLVSKMFRGALT